MIKEWHLARGWRDVGYHFFIRKDGVVERGRSIESIPAAQAGHNSGSIAICAHGLKDFTDIQLQAVKAFCGTIDSAYDNNMTFRGHCEVNVNKTCPVFDYKELLNLDKKGKVKEWQG